MSTLNERLEIMFRHLKSAGLVSTQRELAAAMKTTPGTLNACLKGRERLSIDYLRRIDDAFGHIFNPAWMASGDGDMLRPVCGGTDITIDMSGDTNTASGHATIINGAGSDAVALQMARFENETLRKENARLAAELADARATIAQMQTAIINALNK